MNKYYEIVKLYNDGITDYEELSKKLNISINTVKSYLTKARKEGAIEKKRKKIENTEYEQLIKIYKSGITDYDEISHKLYIPKGTVITYISRAKKEGKIEKTNEKKRNSKYERIIELYKSGITDYEEIAQKTNSTYRTVMSYLSKAKKEGRIEKNRKARTNTKYEQVVEIYKKGTTDYIEIGEKLNISINTARSYLTRIRNEEALKNKQEEKANKAKKEERETIIKKLKQIPLYEEIILNAKNKKITPNEELNQMIMKLYNPLKRIQLAQICFLLNNIKVTQVILNGIISSTSIDANIRKTAIEEKNKIINELKARQEKINENSDVKDKKLDNSEIEK